MTEKKTKLRNFPNLLFSYLPPLFHATLSDSTESPSINPIISGNF